MKSTFSDGDMEQIVAHGLTVEDLLGQIRSFRDGFGPLPVVRAATVGDGILAPDAKAVEYYTREYRTASPGLSIVKFVPASGAATRMFKDLFAYCESGEMNPSAQKTIDNLSRFAFSEIVERGAKGGDLAVQGGGAMAKGLDAAAVARAILDYGSALPKGLILFHRYGNEVRTAVEEHLTEGAQYAASGDRVHIHFTVSPEHEERFCKLIDEVRGRYEKRFGVKYQIEFSHQSPSTDTIAVTPDNHPFRDGDGRLLFRPAGHGALLTNLDAIDADVIFIKNIDNVTTDRLRTDTVTYKHTLGGIMLSVQKKIFNYLGMLDRKPDALTLSHIETFIRKELSVETGEGYASMAEAEKVVTLRRVLDRPLRVCAMVRNEGEPGGGPLWVRGRDGSLALQIGEPSQIASEDSHLLRNGTHFNPVDIVCGTKDYKGRKFPLAHFTDPATGFISTKSKDGRELRALELPGLWNGAMANWNTVFVEVPVSTFTPVKEVNDLLRPEHMQ